MGASGAAHRPLSRELADHLIARKRAVPELQILLLTDPINDVYGGAPSQLLAELRKAGVDVVVTDLERMRDSNPLYSSLWRTLLQWWGNSASGGSMINPFTTEGSGITLRSWLALLNFKANHRKLIVADREDGTLAALVTSANPHDASSGHSNVALRFTGALARDIVGSEMAVARFSGWRGQVYVAGAEGEPSTDQQGIALSFITEEAIRRHLLNAVSSTRNGDSNVSRLLWFCAVSFWLCCSSNCAETSLNLSASRASRSCAACCCSCSRVANVVACCSARCRASIRREISATFSASSCSTCASRSKRPASSARCAVSSTTRARCTSSSRTAASFC